MSWISEAIVPLAALAVTAHQAAAWSLSRRRFHRAGLSHLDPATGLLTIAAGAQEWPREAAEVGRSGRQLGVIVVRTEMLDHGLAATLATAQGRALESTYVVDETRIATTLRVGSRSELVLAAARHARARSSHGEIGDGCEVGVSIASEDEGDLLDLVDAASRRLVPDQRLVRLAERIESAR